MHPGPIIASRLSLAIGCAAIALQTTVDRAHIYVRATSTIMDASQTRPKVDLENKVVLITGAAQGIGLAATRAVLKNGARVSTLLKRSGIIDDVLKSHSVIIHTRYPR